MGYSGAFKNSNAAVGGESRRNSMPRDNWGEGVDPRHNVESGHDQWSDVDPTMVPTALHSEVPTEIEDQFNLSHMPPDIPSPLDGEPKGHEGIGTAPWGVGSWRSQEANNAARSENRGLPKFFQTRETVGRSVTQTFDSQRRQSLPAKTGDNPTDGQSRRALRGRNSLDLNNPGSPEVNGSGNYRRQGWEIVRFTNRWFPRRTITHTKRALHLNLAATAKPSAAPMGDSYSPYTSPFDGRTTQFVPSRQTPMARREPRPWDEDLVTDGSEQSEYTGFNSWGL